MRHICDGVVETRGESRTCGRFLAEQTSTEIVLRCPKCKKETRFPKSVQMTAQHFISFLQEAHKE